MKKSLLNKKMLYNKKMFVIPLVLLLGLGIFSIITWLKPTHITTEKVENSVQFETNYSYQAKYEENILYPNGEVVEAGNIIIRNFVEELPVTISSTVNSVSPVAVNGTHEVKIVLQADKLWTREFPLEEKQSFKLEGKNINLLDSSVFYIDYKELEDFIQEVEDEVSISPQMYTMMIQPNIEGTITYNGKTENFQLNDPLTFQRYFEELVLASDTEFSTPLTSTSKYTVVNTLSILGMELPILMLRIFSTVLAGLLLLAVGYLYKDALRNKTTKIQLESEKISQKYKKRLVPIAQKKYKNEESILQLRSFESVVQIADAKDLQIFHYNDPHDSSKLYFVIDEGYIYQYKLEEGNILYSNKETKQITRLKEESDPNYALDQ